MRGTVLLLAALAASPALAGPLCTNTPVEQWIPAEEMRSRIQAAGQYTIDVFKVTSGKCYEIYGRDKSGRRVEVYFSPVTGEALSKASR